MLKQLVGLAVAGFALNAAVPKPAVPIEPIGAILDAFRSHRIVALCEGRQVHRLAQRAGAEHDPQRHERDREGEQHARDRGHSRSEEQHETRDRREHGRLEAALDRLP